jgi:hypothetical protein
VSAQEVEKAEILTKDPVTVSLQDKIRQQAETIDSLVLLIVKMKEEGSIVKDIDDLTQHDEDIVDLGKLALRLDQKLFEVLNKEAEIDEIRKYFLPRFSANFVTVNIEGEGSIAIVTHENFGQHIGDSQEDERSYKIVNIDFLDTKVAGDIFNMAYKTIVESYVDGKLYAEQSVLTTLTGRRDNHGWKVGSYSSTSIEFEPEH